MVNASEYSLSINNVGKHHIYARVVDGDLWIGNESNDVKGKTFIALAESSANFGLNACAGYGTGLGYSGYEDAIRIYNRPLSSSEIARNYAIDKVCFGIA